MLEIVGWTIVIVLGLLLIPYIIARQFAFGYLQGRRMFHKIERDTNNGEKNQKQES